MSFLPLISKGGGVGVLVSRSSCTDSEDDDSRVEDKEGVGGGTIEVMGDARSGGGGCASLCVAARTGDALGETTASSPYPGGESNILLKGCLAL